jgi:hypothetical protein
MTHAKKGTGDPTRGLGERLNETIKAIALVVSLLCRSER